MYPLVLHSKITDHSPTLLSLVYNSTNSNIKNGNDNCSRKTISTIDFVNLSNKLGNFNWNLINNNNIDTYTEQFLGKLNSEI